MYDLKDEYDFKAGEAFSRFTDELIQQALTAPAKPVTPPTRWQIVKRNIRRPYQYLGERFTRWLMEKFDIYESDW